jgi:ATP-dependent helicase HrpB
MLEPRRLAARAAAERMAEIWASPAARPWATASGARRRSSEATRIEVVTEGILTRMVQDAPDLPGIGTVIFDEFHERSLNADLGLALTWEARGALRPTCASGDVRHARRRARWPRCSMDAPVISSEGRAYPVETRWLDRARGRDTTLGPGHGRPDPARDGRNRRRLPRLPARRGRDPPRGGACSRAACRGTCTSARSTAPCPSPISAPRSGPSRGAQAGARHIAIAETSLTIEDIRVVVDGGKARRARFDPAAA